MKLLNTITSVTLLCLSLSGCASIFGDNNRQVNVNSNPQGAQVYLNNQYMGTTPTSLVLNNLWSTNQVQLKMPGYEPVSNDIDGKFQPVGLWNILFWPGFIVDAISGDMMKVPPDSKNISANFAKS